MFIVCSEQCLFWEICVYRYASNHRKYYYSYLTLQLINTGPKIFKGYIQRQYCEIKTKKMAKKILFLKNYKLVICNLQSWYLCNQTFLLLTCSWNSIKISSSCFLHSIISNVKPSSRFWNFYFG